jgi:hypothetical protein
MFCIVQYIYLTITFQFFISTPIWQRGMLYFLHLYVAWMCSVFLYHTLCSGHHVTLSFFKTVNRRGHVSIYRQNVSTLHISVMIVFFCHEVIWAVFGGLLLISSKIKLLTMGPFSTKWKRYFCHFFIACQHHDLMSDPKYQFSPCFGCSLL